MSCSCSTAVCAEDKEKVIKIQREKKQKGECSKYGDVINFFTKHQSDDICAGYGPFNISKAPIECQRAIADNRCCEYCGDAIPSDSFMLGVDCATRVIKLFIYLQTILDGIYKCCNETSYECGNPTFNCDQWDPSATSTTQTEDISDASTLSLFGVYLLLILLFISQ